MTNCVELAERAAAAATAITDPTAEGAASDAAADAENDDEADAAHAAFAAAAAAATANPAAAAAFGFAATAAGEAIAAADARGVVAQTGVLIFGDLENVLKLSKKHCWNDNTPVPPEVFGPLWGESPPPWAVSESTKPEEKVLTPTNDPGFTLILRALADPGTSTETISQQLVKLFEALNEYSLAKYGRRLTKDQFRRLIHEHSLVEV